ncbi:MAG: 4Fe-4S binding protein [Candidatus Helarchaeota archaeon]|nr:4Fe-4S binding protein [Candidatus Helarchaeota archaeon]
MSSQIWKKVARNIVNAGVMPFPINDTVIEFLQAKIPEDQAKFLLIFKKPSLNLDQIKEQTDLNEEEILQMLEMLMNNGIVSGNPSRSTGIMVYSLMPLFPGIIEFSLMKGETSEKEKNLARIIDKVFKTLQEGTQRNYDTLMPQFKDLPPPARVIPVEENVQVGQEEVLLAEEASRLIDHQDNIALTYCYCKQQKDLINNPCKVTDKREVCLIFNKPAQFAIKYNFARPISKSEAKTILKEVEDAGLVHKVFHSKLDFSRDIDGICSCCKCCCGIFRLYYDGVWPLHTMTSYIAKPINEECIGCGTCVEKCQMEAISLIDELIVIDEAKCIGCGVCAHLCPQNAITIERSGPREVFVLPPKIKQN